MNVAAAAMAKRMPLNYAQATRLPADSEVYHEASFAKFCEELGELDFIATEFGNRTPAVSQNRLLEMGRKPYLGLIQSMIDYEAYAASSITRTGISPDRSPDIAVQMWEFGPHQTSLSAEL